MKSMNIKKEVLTAIFCLLLSPVMAQKIIEKKIPYQEGKELSFNLPIGERIKITGWDKKEVAVTATVNINNNTLNEAYQLEVDEGNGIKIAASLDEEILATGKAEDCDGNYSFHSNKEGKNSAVCVEILYEIQVPRSASLKLETISADVEATGLENSSQIKSISGFIDFSWPSQKDANLQLKSITGELYTDLNFDILNKQDSPPIVGYTLKGRKGNGGPTLDLETISSDIFLRKQ